MFRKVLAAAVRYWGACRVLEPQKGVAEDYCKTLCFLPRGSFLFLKWCPREVIQDPGGIVCFPARTRGEILPRWGKQFFSLSLSLCLSLTHILTVEMDKIYEEALKEKRTGDPCVMLTCFLLCRITACRLGMVKQMYIHRFASCTLVGFRWVGSTVVHTFDRVDALRLFRLPVIIGVFAPGGHQILFLKNDAPGINRKLKYRGA